MNTSFPVQRRLNIDKIINKNLSKYNKSKEEFSKCIIKNLIFHKKSHFISIFTEYLIWDDNQEFLFELFPKKYSLINIPLFIKFQYHKNYFPIIRDNCGRTQIKKNIKMKKILYTYLSEKTKQTTEISKNLMRKYSNILPKDLSQNTIIKNNIENKGKENNESESTIDNVNANNDISYSLDLKINKNYDNKILTENIGFVKGKNGKNDIELLNMLKLLKPINTAYIYQNNKSKIKNKLIYLNYINNKKSIDKYRYTESTKNLLNNKHENKYYKKKINSLSNKSKNIININTKKDIKFYSKSNKNSKKIIHLNHNNNIIVLNKYNDYTTRTKPNSPNTSYKNKSRNKNIDNNNSKNLEKNNTTQNLKLPNYSEHIEHILITPLYNESKILKEEKKFNKKINMKKGLYKYGKQSNKDLIKGNSGPYMKKIIISNNSRDKNDVLYKNNIKILRNEIKTKNENDGCMRFIDISPDNKKTKLLYIYKNNNNIMSNINIFKKQKSVENQLSFISNNKDSYNLKSEKKNKNIIIVKKKFFNNINIYN